MKTYKGKTIGIVGMSIEGRDALKFLVQEGANIHCYDRREGESFGLNNLEFTQYPHITWHFGNEYLSDLDDCDMILRSPGVHPQLPQLIAYAKNGRKVSSPTALFFEECIAPIIGVTGTKGKGTTSTLIAEMLKESKYTVFLGGNVGVPLLSQVRSIKKTDRVVYELSSFQLEDMTVSPHIAVVLKVTQEHLKNFDPMASNYHETRNAYVQAKIPIVKYQKSNDFAVIYGSDQDTKSFAHYSKGSIRYFGYDSSYMSSIQNDSVLLYIDKKKHIIATLRTTKLHGRHNLENIAAAACASSLAGANLDSITSVSNTFEGLPHRLEVVSGHNGILYINDSFSTVPETAIAAIRSFDKPLHLIAGGSDKGSTYQTLGQEIAQSTVKTLILIGQMAQKIESAAEGSGFHGEIYHAMSLHDAVCFATSKASKGDVVLFSPACASFDMFKNYKHRGSEFIKEVHDSI